MRAVYAELQSTQPAGLRYSTLRLDDGVSFVHLAETAEGENPLPKVAAFQRFQENIAERCEEQPVATEANVVGSFNLFAA